MLLKKYLSLLKVFGVFGKKLRSDLGVGCYLHIFSQIIEGVRCYLKIIEVTM